MYAVCVSDTRNLTDTCISWFEKRKDADISCKRWAKFYGSHAACKVLDDKQVCESIDKGRFRDYSDTAVKAPEPRKYGGYVRLTKDNIEVDTWK